jgi:CBS domain containing-hemolysin-like protein
VFDLTVGLGLLVFLLVALGAAVLTAEEAAARLLTAGRVHRLAETDRPGARRLAELLAGEPRLASAAALARAVAFGLAGLVSVNLSAALVNSSLMPTGNLSSLSAFLVYLAIITVAVFGVVGIAFSLLEALPRTIGVANPERVALTAAPVAAALTSFLAPIAGLLSALWVWSVHLVGGERISSPWIAEEAERTAEQGDEDADREEAEEAFLEAMSDFAEKVTREVMVPRPDVAALSDTATISEAIALIERRGFSRLPVYHGSVDDIRGVLYAKDILITLGRDAHACSTDTSISPLVRPAIYVPETKPVEELLVEMRTAHTHIAVVADEYGGTAGIVTLEDLLEEIVGEIADEYDRELPLITDLGDGSYRVDARLPVDDLNEQFGTAAEPEFDTVGGLVLEVAGHIPVVGESVEIDGVRLTVDRLEGNRIRQLVVQPAAREDEGE